MFLFCCNMHFHIPTQNIDLSYFRDLLSLANFPNQYSIVLQAKLGLKLNSRRRVNLWYIWGSHWVHVGSPFHGVWLAASLWVEVFLYTYQLQFNIVLRSKELSPWVVLAPSPERSKDWVDCPVSKVSLKEIGNGTEQFLTLLWGYMLPEGHLTLKLPSVIF